MGTNRTGFPGQCVDGGTPGAAAQINGVGAGKVGRSRLQADGSFQPSLQLVTTIYVPVATADRVLDIHVELTVVADGGPQGVAIIVTEDDGSGETRVGRANYDLARANVGDHKSPTFEATPAAPGIYIYRLYVGPAGADGNAVGWRADNPDPTGIDGFGYLWAYDVAKLSDFADDGH